VLERDVVALVRQMPGWERSHPLVTPIATGITNRNFCVDIDGRRFVARIPGERTELLGIDRAGEVAAARIAAELGIGPPVIGVLPGVGTLVTELVEGVEADAAALVQPGALERVAAAIARFHTASPIAHRFPIFRVVEWHARDAVAAGITLPEAWKRLSAQAGRIEAVFHEDELESTVCHNDLLPANMLLGPQRLWLIDYEYAGMNHALFDLANLSVNCGLDADADARLLNAYGTDERDATIARLQLMKIMSELREGMWAVVQQAISTLDHVDFRQYAAERLDHCLELCAAAELDGWLAAAAARRPGQRR